MILRWHVSIASRSRRHGKSQSQFGSNELDLNPKANRDYMKISSVKWEYEDQLPKMEDFEFYQIFKVSRIIEGVRMYPFVETDLGERIYISE
jgi:hypothetical protein